MSSTLRQSVHTKATNKAYDKSLYLFLYYCQSEGIEEELELLSSSGDNTCSLTHSIDVLDRTCSEYIEDLYVRGGKFYKASNLVHSLHFYYPLCKGRLVESALCLRGWSNLNLQSKVYKCPLTKELATCIAVSMCKGGNASAGIATLLAFDCYLRVGELCSLRVCDIGLPSSKHFGSSYSGMSVGLKRTKTGPHQSVMVRDNLVSTLIHSLVQTLDSRSTTSLFSFSPSQYRSMFHSAIVTLGLSDYNLTPHSLRHGGATADYVSNPMSLDGIILRGRWAATKSVRTYIQSGVYLSIQVKEPQLQHIGLQINSNPSSLISLFIRSFNSQSQ